MRRLGVKCNPQPLFLGERRCHRGPRDSGKLNQADWASFILVGAVFCLETAPAGPENNSPPRGELSQA